MSSELRESIYVDPIIGKMTTLSKIEETVRISSEIIDNLTEEAIDELMKSSYERDIDKMFDTIITETYDTLYGKKDLITTAAFGYLDKLSKSVEETLRTENLAYFITSVLKDFEVNWHHLDWCSLIQTTPYLAIEASRDGGKSYLFSNAYPAWMLYGYKGDLQIFSRRNSLKKKGYLFSFSSQQAVDLMEILKDTIMTYDDLREKLYPGKQADSESARNWGQYRITCKNGASLRVKGFGASVRGAHPGWIVIDDPLKDNVIYSSVQRKKQIEYFHATIMNMILPGGQVLVVGTPMHSLDLYGDLKTKKSWVLREYPAIFPDGKLLWENRYSYTDLMKKREAQGNLIFSREILCRPVNSESTIFPMEILNRAFIGMENYTLVYSRDMFPVKFKKVVTACDFAISANVGADYSVFGTWGIDESDTMWLINFWREKGRSYAEQLALIKHINSTFQPDIIVMEKNNFQVIFTQEAERAGLPVVPHQTTGSNKHDMLNGLPALALMFERGKIKIPTGDQKSKDVADMHILEFSHMAFTDEKGIQGVGEHDDIPMETWLATVGMKMMSSTQLHVAWLP